MIDIYKEKNFKEIEKKYQLTFEDKDLLVRAFTHGSFNNELIGNYQRLEFLGDAVLQMVVSDYMYRFHGGQSEGDMSKQRGALVSEYALAWVVRREGLDKFLIYGKSLREEEIANTTSYVSDVYEALVAAIYLDLGYAKVEKFIKNTLIENKDELLTHDFLKDYKTELQEELQANGTIDIKYESVEENNIFTAAIMLEGNKIGIGKGKTKKQAEQQAAKYALKNRVK